MDRVTEKTFVNHSNYNLVFEELEKKFNIFFEKKELLGRLKRYSNIYSTKRQRSKDNSVKLSRLRNKDNEKVHARQQNNELKKKSAQLKMLWRNQ